MPGNVSDLFPFLQRPPSLQDAQVSMQQQAQVHVAILASLLMPCAFLAACWCNSSGDWDGLLAVLGITCDVPTSICLQDVSQPLPQVFLGSASNPRPTAEAEAAGSRLGAWSQAPPAESPTAQPEPSNASVPFEKVTLCTQHTTSTAVCRLSCWNRGPPVSFCSGIWLTAGMLTRALHAGEGEAAQG